ncbi:MAG: hypothetical protein ACOZQL_20950 [Myxococcota bacterium]
MCWYWKVNATLEQLGRLEALLRSIDNTLRASATQESVEEEEG